MELNSYCNSVATELVGWKARVYDTVRKLDQKPSGDKEKVSDEVRELHMLIDEIDDRIDRLRQECPTEWSPEERDIEAKSKTLHEVWKRTEDTIGGSVQRV